MAYVPPITWTLGQLVGATVLNEQLRDNLTFFKVLVNDDGKIPALSSTYVADLDVSALTGVAKLAESNDFTDGVHDFGAGANTRLVIPVGTNKYAV